MKKLLTITMAVLLGLMVSPPFSQPAGAADKPIELNYNCFFPAQYGMGVAAGQWAREVEKRSGGRLKITMYYGGTLSPASACYESVVMGSSDIGQSCLAYTRGRFPLMEVIDLPGYPLNAQITTRVAEDVYRKFKPKELSDVHVLYMHAHMPGVIYTRDKPVRTLADLKGLRIRSTGLSAKILKALGAVPVSMSKGDQYDAMYKGVVDGTVGGLNELKGWRVAEVAKYSTVCPKVGYVTAMFVVMNLDKWNSLPKDLQKVLDDVSHEWVGYTGKAWNKIEKEGIAYGKEKGHHFIILSDEECAKWGKAIQPIFNDYVQAMKKKNLPGEEALKYRNQRIEKYSKKYPPLSL